jgi:argininosuccinate lyase
VTKLWGGRFTGELDAELRRFSSSLPFDRRLAAFDVQGGRAHAAALRDAGVLDEDEMRALATAFDRIEEEIAAGTFPPQAEGDELPEDVHSAVEARLVELCGETGRRIHAGRSRNDQVVTDLLLWLREKSERVESEIRELQFALVDAAEAHESVVIFAYTHLQRAQPVLLAHHLLAHFEALDRDVDRLRDARSRADRCPLGAGACAGSSLPLDRGRTAERLGFARVAENSLDAVSDRDWALEFVSACAIALDHMSRLAEEIVLWSSGEFGIVTLDDAWCTGSSMLPQKRNPDVAELVRGKAARVHGHLMALHSLIKGMPLAYNRDLQEGQEPLFDAADATEGCARMLAGAIASAVFHEPAADAADMSAATDLAEELVRRRVPFREAHERVGRLVAACEAGGRGLADATDEELAAIGLADLDRELLTARGSIAAKKTFGSTAPAEVARALATARERAES